MQPAIRYTYFAVHGVHGIPQAAFKPTPSVTDDLLERVDMFMAQSRVIEDSESESV